MSGHGVKHTDWLIRETSPHDDREIREMNRLAFWSEAEGVLVARLRAEGAVILSLLGVAGERIVGHVLFARVFVRHPAGVMPGVCLAPLASCPPGGRAASVRRWSAPVSPHARIAARHWRWSAGTNVFIPDSVFRQNSGGSSNKRDIQQRARHGWRSN